MHSNRSIIPRWFRYALLPVAALLAGNLLADVRLPHLISDGMVLQQAAEVAIWGWADDGEKITVSFQGQTASTVARNGQWQVRLPPLPAGGPATLTITGHNQIVLKEVYVGEVWLGSGQSNMVMPLNRKYVGVQVRGGEPAAVNSSNSMIRLFTVPLRGANQPADDVNARWQACGPATVADFSALAYFFGRDLQAARKTPIGLIVAAGGGSPIESWIAPQVLQAQREYQPVLDAMRKRVHQYEQSLKDGTAAQWKASGQPFAPGAYYCGMIAPLQRFAIRGVLWYQGESNVGRAALYQKLLADLIASWRGAWGRGALPFLIVQLAPYQKISDQPAAHSAWAELREAQALTVRAVTNTALVVTTDLADREDNPHPVEKEAVGLRLAHAARALAYGEKLAYQGPELDRVDREGTQLRIRFLHAGAGLMVQGDRLKGIAVAGADQRWVWANAVVEGNDTLRVDSPEVPAPVRVSCGWADYPVVNLFNRDGFPAVPFRAAVATQNAEESGSPPVRKIGIQP